MHNMSIPMRAKFMEERDFARANGNDLFMSYEEWLERKLVRCADRLIKAERIIGKIEDSFGKGGYAGAQKLMDEAKEFLNAEKGG